MSAHIIQFEPRRAPNLGNGARETMIAIALSFPNTSKEDAEDWTDWMLAEFWDNGFKVVPLNLGDGT